MPHKFNANRRHKFGRQKYRVINWSAYNESLRQRGDLTIWVSDETLCFWFAARRTSRGDQPLSKSDVIKVVWQTSAADDDCITAIADIRRTLLPLGPQRIFRLLWVRLAVTVQIPAYHSYPRSSQKPPLPPHRPAKLSTISMRMMYLACL